jgi:hypothetical protein
MGRQFCNSASCSLKIWREHGLRVLENGVLRVLEKGVLRVVLGRQAKEVLAYRTAVRKQELLLCVNPDLIMQSEMGGVCST